MPRSEQSTDRKLTLSNGESIMRSELNNMSQTERLELIRRAGGKTKYDLLTEARDGAFLIPRLPAQDLFLMIREIGDDILPEILEYTTPDQVQGFIDFDCWDRDTFTSEQFTPWLTGLLETPEEQVIRVVTGIDFELLCLAIGARIRILRGIDTFFDEDGDTPGRALNLYDIEYLDSETAKQVERLLDILYRLDNPYYLRLMEGIRAELPTMLEEDAYRFSRNRMLDLGFEESYSARRIFAPIDPERFTQESPAKEPLPLEDVAGGSTYALSNADPRGILADVMAQGISAETVQEMTFLLNRFLSAEDVSCGDLSTISDAGREMFGYINIALGHLHGDDSKAARKALESWYLQDLFRLGYSLTLQLQSRARELSKGIVRFLDAPFTQIIDALCQPRPRLFSGILEDGKQEERLYTMIREVRLTGSWLDRLGVQQRLFSEILPFAPLDPAAIATDGCNLGSGSLTLSSLYLTSLANRLLDREFTPMPISKEEFAEVHRLLFTGGIIDERVRTETAAFLDQLLPGAGDFSDFALAIAQEQMGEIDPDSADPRFIRCMLIRM